MLVSFCRFIFISNSIPLNIEYLNIETNLLPEERKIANENIIFLENSGNHPTRISVTMERNHVEKK